MRIFRDSTTPRLIPVSGTDGVLVYANGDYIWPEEQVARFTAAGKQVAHIDVIGNGWRLAKILDVERYDATIGTARTWIPQRNEFRGDATIYTGHDNLDELFSACHGLAYWLIVADWTGSPHELSMPLPAGVKMAGTQYATVPGNFDTSAIYADQWHPVPAK